MFDFVVGSLRVLGQTNIGSCILLFYTVLHEAWRGNIRLIVRNFMGLPVF